MQLWAGSPARDPSSFTYALLKALSEEYHFDLNTPYEKLSPEIQNILIHGTDGRKVKVHYKGQRGQGVYDVAFEGLIKNVVNGVTVRRVRKS